MRKIAALLLLVCLCLPARALQEDSRGWRLAAQNENYSMYVSFELGNFYLISRDTGRIFTAYPREWEQDPYAKGANKKLIASLLAIESYSARGVISATNCRAGSMEKEASEGRLIKDGFEIDYDFPSLSISVTLRIALTEDGFTAEAPLDRVSERGEDQLASIILLPFLCSGGENDDGYLFYPDGCGALIDYDQKLSFRAEIVRPLYGRDLAAASLTVPREEEALRLPVFGAKTGDKAILGIVESAEGACSLRLASGGDNAAYYRVFPSFTYRETQTVALFENTASERVVSQIAEKTLARSPKARYILLEDELADYSGMATVYRERLLSQGTLVQRDSAPALCARVYGAVRKKVVTLGVPHTLLKTLTTFAQAGEIARALADEGVKTRLLLTGFSASGTLNRSTPAISPAGALGGEKGLKELKALCDSLGFKTSAAAELIAVYNDGNGYSALRDASRFASDGVAWQYAADKVDYGRDYAAEKYSLLKPQKLAQRLSDYVKSAAAFGLDTELAVWGSALYSQQGKADKLTRDEALGIWSQAAQGSDVISDGGNLYALSSLLLVTDAPMRATGYDLETREIPFYQMVVHGLLPYSGEALNAATDGERAMLKMLEYGASPYAEWFYSEDRTVTQFTLLNDVFSGDYRPWLETAARWYKAANEVWEASEGSVMARHDLTDSGVARVTYGNGARLYVNSSGFDAEADGLTVPAMSYRLEGAR